MKRKYKDVVATCNYCNKTFKKRENMLHKFNFCCLNHKFKGMVGEKSSQYGVKPTPQHRKKISDSLKITYKDPEIRKKCNTWEGKQHTKETKIKMSNIMKGKKHRPLTEKEKEFQRNLWTPEKKAARRAYMEKMGYWKPLSEKSDWDIYHSQASFNRRMFDIIKNGVELLKEYSIFNVKNNKNGVVRDHIYSVKNGFKNKVFPSILRHPCNCQIIRNYDNIKKAFNKNNGNEIALESLFDKIKKYNGDWHEHKMCLRDIKKYERGERWNRKMT